MKNERDLNYYLGLPYTVVVRKDEDGDYVARVDELPGCSAHGNTRYEAVENLEEAQQLWITDALEAGDAIPEPATEGVLPSGKWVQRVPKTLHRKLADAARREGVSLNQLVTSFLAEAVGQRIGSAEVGTTLEPWGKQTEPALHHWLGSHAPGMDVVVVDLSKKIQKAGWEIEQPPGRQRLVRTIVAGWEGFGDLYHEHGEIQDLQHDTKIRTAGQSRRSGIRVLYSDPKSH